MGHFKEKFEAAYAARTGRRFRVAVRGVQSVAAERAAPAASERVVVFERAPRWRRVDWYLLAGIVAALAAGVAALVR